MDITKQGLNALSQRCAEESGRYFRKQPNETHFCFELFRRAFVEKDQLAWEKLYNIYRPLIIGWVTSSPGFSSSGEEVGYFINRAVEKMWISISAQKFERFEELNALLRYLKMCVGSVIIDHMRTRERMKYEEIPSSPAKEPVVTGLSIEEQVADRLDANEFWQLIEGSISDHLERYVLIGSYVYDLKPREILNQYSKMFQDIQQIYRIKENILARLRRNPELIEYLREYVGETG